MGSRWTLQPSLVDNGRLGHCTFNQQTGPDTTKDPPGPELFQSLLNLYHILRNLRPFNNTNLHHPHRAQRPN
jgi:hypothetical protein